MSEDWMIAGPLTSYELKVLEMLDGRRQLPQPAAWVNACVECLAGRGLCSRVYPHTITAAGRAFLDKKKES